MNFEERAARAAPFYYQYWDYAQTESVDDSQAGPRNAAAEAIADLLCFAHQNGVDPATVVAEAKKILADAFIPEALTEGSNSEE